MRLVRDEIMRGALTGLVWEIWARNRRLLWAITGLLLFAWLLNFALPESFRATQSLRERLLTLNCFLMSISLLLVFTAFNYTELNPQREWTGFPYRLFVLPVSTWRLAAVPITLGLVSVELVYWGWLKLVFVRQEIPVAGWLAILLGVYLVFYETILWCLARFRILRILALSFGGTSFIAAAVLPCFSAYVSSPWFSVPRLSAGALALSAGAFAFALRSLQLERTGGGVRPHTAREWLERLSNLLPHREAAFKSAAGAQFWFEWRRSGWLLPVSIGAALVLVITPISWMVRQDPNSAPWILGWTLAMPAILALPIGKAFSKPEVWSPGVSVRSFDAVRPLATGEMVVIKLKTAALSAAIAWLLVSAFLCAWLSGWADLRVLAMARIGFWMVYSHSAGPQYAIIVLTAIAGMLLTWRILVHGLWLGLSGRPKWFVMVPAAYCVGTVAALLGLVILTQQKQANPEGWLRDPNRLLEWIQWFAAIALVAKVWLAAWSWRFITPRRVRRYFLLWASGVGCVAVLVWLVWAKGALVALGGPFDPVRLRNTLLLAAMLLLPLARLGLTPVLFAKNRHGETAGDLPVK